MFNIVLIEPEIPNNTGNIGRTCVGNNCALHLVGKLGFEISDKQLRRAGLDYWANLEFCHHHNLEEWLSNVEDLGRLFLMTTKASQSLYEAQFQEGDWLVFGPETRGLSQEFREQFSQQCYKIPMLGDIRSLNLANAVAITAYEALRQVSFSAP